MYRGSVCGKGEIIIFQHRNMCSKKWRAFFIFDDPVLYYDLHGWIELWFIYRILLWLGTAADAATADTCTYVYYQIRSQHCKYLTKVIMFRVDKVQIKIQKKATSKIDSSFLLVNNCSFCCFLLFFFTFRWQFIVPNMEFCHGACYYVHNRNSNRKHRKRYTDRMLRTVWKCLLKHKV